MQVGDDSLKTLQSLLSLLIHHWQHSALEAQAYRRITETNQSIQDQATAILSSPQFVERQNLADALRNRVLAAVASDSREEIAEVLGELSALLGRTPTAPSAVGSL
jgi:hypothetical protein